MRLSGYNGNKEKIDRPGKGEAIYMCDECGTCFPHDDVGDHVLGICPLGTSTYSTKQEVKPKKKES